MKTRGNRSHRRWIATAVLSIGLFSFAACGSDEPSAVDPQGAQGTDDGGEVVEMRLIAYKPAELEVPAGTAVTWKQQDAGFHTVTSGTVVKGATVKTTPDGTFDSGQLAKGKEFTHTFGEAGTFEYFCEVHPATMNGQVTVQ